MQTLVKCIKKNPTYRSVVGDVSSKSNVGAEYAVWRLGLAIDRQDGVGITVNYPEGTTVK